MFVPLTNREASPSQVPPGPVDSSPANVARGKSTKRSDILEAALALFVDRGFHGTAVPALARRANVGAGTIYRYFENKEALVNVLYRQWKTAIAEHVTGDLGSDLGKNLEPRELFARFWRRTVEFAKEHPRAFAFLELHHHSSYLDRESREVEARVRLLASGLIEALKSRGALRNQPADLLMSIIYGALVGFVQGAWEGRYPLDDDHSRGAEDCAWQAICS